MTGITMMSHLSNIDRFLDYLPTASCVSCRLSLGACLCAGSLDERLADEVAEIASDIAIANPIGSCAWTGDLLPECRCTRCCPHENPTCHCDSMEVFESVQTWDSVQVTEADIAAGRPRQPESCPIALAIRRQHPYISKVSVEQGSGITVTGPGNRVLVSELLDEEREWIRRFDRGEEVSPIELKASISIVKRASDAEWEIVMDFLHYCDEGDYYESHPDDRF